MNTARKTANGGAASDEVVVTFRTSKRLRDQYADIVKRDERTLSQSLRLHMASVVADNPDKAAA